MSDSQGTNFAHGHEPDNGNSQKHGQKDLKDLKEAAATSMTDNYLGEQSNRNNTATNLLPPDTDKNEREKDGRAAPSAPLAPQPSVPSNQNTPRPADPEGSLNRPYAYGTFGNSPRPAQYEELFGGTMACPTCRGTGRIPRDSADEMVALIPIRDKRLRPRRTCLYVSIAVLICVAIAGLLLYFLLPRNIRLESKHGHLRPIVRVVNISEQYVFLSLLDQYNISNDNFFPVYVTEFEVDTSFDQKAQTPVKNNTKITIPMRSKVAYSIQVNLTFEGSEGYIAYYCSKGIPGSHSLLMPFMATLTTSYLGHQEETTLQSYKLVQCGPEKMEWSILPAKPEMFQKADYLPKYDLDNR